MGDQPSPSERRPFWPSARAAGICWVAAYLPLEAGKFARLVRRARCPMCAAAGRRVAIARQDHGVLLEPKEGVTMSVGKNTASGERLRSFVERIEERKAVQKQAGQDIAAIKAEAKAEGFDPSGIAYLVKVRAMKPHDRQEAEALRDMYLHAMGMASEPPLFRAAGIAAVDTAAREQVIDRMKPFVPAAGLGDIVVNWGGQSIRLTRNAAGEVVETEVVERPVAPKGKLGAAPAGPAKADIPAVDEAGAYDLGRRYGADNRPVIDNPFPYGDPRRRRFDEGWRDETGNDGMGPDD